MFCGRLPRLGSRGKLFIHPMVPAALTGRNIGRVLQGTEPEPENRTSRVVVASPSQRLEHLNRTTRPTGSSTRLRRKRKKENLVIKGRPRGRKFDDVSRHVCLVQLAEEGYFRSSIFATSVHAGVPQAVRTQVRIPGLRTRTSRAVGGSIFGVSTESGRAGISLPVGCRGHGWQRRPPVLALALLWYSRGCRADVSWPTLVVYLRPQQA